MTFARKGRKVFRRISGLDVAEQSFERIIIRLDDSKMFAGPLVHWRRPTFH